jgi:DNA helicase-2/ATP-dependent DNA helicase PcrA
LGAGRFLGRARPSTTAFTPSHPSQPAPAEPPQPVGPRFQTGDDVQHEIFGKGVVIESKVERGDEQVTVAFAGIGLKRLMASMAPLEKLEEGD